MSRQSAQPPLEHEVVVPTFAVVGRVNKGKSSVIATLAEDDRVPVSPLPGTTRKTTRFPVSVDGVPLFTLVDTPGFEQAPAVLAWLEQEPVSAEQRPARVAAFVSTFQDSDRYAEECRLLAPILAGAGILYVVDGDRPYRENYRAEMEILRWTGRPRMALINRGAAGQNAEAWKSALAQYFQVVREFDAHRATFDERIRLLTTLRELHDPWREAVQLAIDALVSEGERRRIEAAHIITDLMVEALGFSLQTRGEPDVDPRGLEDTFHDGLRKLEQQARDRLAHLYNHDKVIWRKAQDLVRPVFGEDLFAKRTWTSLGLSAGQLLATYTVSGAVTGGLVDVGVGGASFGAGALIGALAGAGATAYHLSKRFEQAQRLDHMVDRLRQVGEGGPAYRVGPFKHPNFPFVLLDRALRYQAVVRDRAHALSAAGDLHADSTQPEDLGERLTPEQRRALAALFAKVQKQADQLTPEVRAALYEQVLSLLPVAG